ncbi:MAG: HIT family protein [Methylotenera sp.]|nr:HIT family protein [Methylotenera sp.]MDO9233925.1 HIT family protein [Methylotenera sp.]MDO9388855.1 HIT family protein [Methylotenera sp.]MDP1595453.1 HIT family protein [Methylotenera sp.]MDP1755357.1 HIT family protein [Methylotenera sp.]
MNPTCPLCQPTTHETLWQDDFCRVVLLNDADYPAYCRVELLAHVKEMTDLPPPQRARMMKTVFAVEVALREVIHPDKINLASLGNKTPHVHWHVIPRFEHDKHFPNSHWGEVLRGGSPAQLDINDKKILIEKMGAHIECALKSK